MRIPETIASKHWMDGGFLFFVREVFDGQQDHLPSTLRFDATGVENHVSKTKMLQLGLNFILTKHWGLRRGWHKSGISGRRSVALNLGFRYRQPEFHANCSGSPSDPPQDLSYNLPLPVHGHRAVIAIFRFQ